MSGGTVQCRVCASGNTTPKPFGYAFENRWLGAVECRDCGMIFIDPQPTPEQITRLYSHEYFEGDFRCGHAGSYFDENALEAIVDRPLLERIARERPAPGEFLEIGCAGGAFLNAAARAGYRVRGVEFSDEAAAFARKKFALDVFTGDVRDARLAGGAFDVVFMGDVIEHLTDPVATLREVHRVMKSGALLVLVCPSQTNTLFSRCGFALYELLGKRATVHLPPYHLFEYRPASMASFLNRCGFRVRHVAVRLIPPGEIALRGSAGQRIGKKLFHYPNYVLNALFGVLGDRLEVFAVKPE